MGLMLGLVLLCSVWDEAASEAMACPGGDCAGSPSAWIGALLLGLALTLGCLGAIVVAVGLWFHNVLRGLR